MTDAAIWDAFCARLSSYAAGLSPAVPVIFDGAGGEPPTTGPWFEAAFFPNTTRNYGIDNSGPFSLVGFCQVTVCTRIGAGLNPGLSLVAGVIDHFDKGTVIGSALVTKPAHVSSVLTEPDRLQYPVTIPYAQHGSR